MVNFFNFIWTFSSVNAHSCYLKINSIQKLKIIKTYNFLDLKKCNTPDYLDKNIHVIIFKSEYIFFGFDLHDVKVHTPIFM